MVDARSARLLALLANRLPFARGKRGEEAVEIFVAAIVPVILRIGALQHARLPKRLPLFLQGERRMPGGSPLPFRGFDGRGGKIGACVAFREAGPDKKAVPRHGREGYGGLKLRIIAAARQLVSLGPGVVEDVFAVRMGLEIAGQDRDGGAIGLLQHEMARKPARFRRSRAAFLKREKECVRQKRIVRPAGRVRASVPLLRRDIAHALKYADA